MKIITSKKAALIATVLALPFVILGSFFWIQIFLTGNITDKYIFHWISQLIFLLGSPLTLIYLLSLGFFDKLLKDNLGNNLVFLVLPILNALFLLQWIIWSQIIVLIYRKLLKPRKLP